jgi:hypothetical protein
MHEIRKQINPIVDEKGIQRFESKVRVKSIN